MQTGIERGTFLAGVAAAGVSLALPGYFVLAPEAPRKDGHLVVGLAGGQTGHLFVMPAARMVRQVVMIDSQSGFLIGGSDPRKDRAMLGW